MLYQLFWLFLAFSFLGWCLEVAATAVRLGQYRDRGVLHGPLCLVYGITGCLITIALRELSGGWFFLFLFSALYATVVEWIAGHLLEHYSHTRWWDYSDCKWNLDGYICLSASVVWGALGLVTVKWLVPLLMRLYQLVPAGLAHVLLWIFAILLVIDLLGTALTLGGLRYKLPRVDKVNNRLANLTLRMGLWIFDRTERRPDKVLFHTPTKLGKGVLVAAGAILAIQPVLLPFLAIIFLVCLIPTGMVSLGSITMAAAYPVLTLVYSLMRGLPTQDVVVCTVGAAIMGGMVIWMHRANIQRIREGKEYRFGSKHKQ